MGCKIELASEYAVVGFEPEMADLGNPNGALVDLRYYWQSTFPNGERYVYGQYVTTTEAEQDLERGAPPVEFWNEIEPEYGSKAYLAYVASHAHDPEWMANN